MSADTDIAAAEAEAERRRQQLLTTATALKTRLKPAVLAHDAADRLKDTGKNAAQAGIDVVKRNPAASIGVVAALAALVARKPIARLFRRAKNNRNV